MTWRQRVWRIVTGPTAYDRAYRAGFVAGQLAARAYRDQELAQARLAATREALQELIEFASTGAEGRIQ